jgi:hypothetical protein
VQLPAPARLGRVIDQHPPGGEERLDLAAAMDDASSWPSLIVSPRIGISLGTGKI